MKITLEEDNGFISGDGKPTLVVLVVTMDDGQQRRIPYHADRTIQQLYEDVRKIKIPFIIPLPLPRLEVASDEDVVRALQAGKINILNSSAREIEREDIVKCVKLHPREPGSDCDLSVGDLYRVIDIKKQNGELLYYEVIDDNSKNKTRIVISPDEVELIKKAVKPSPRKNIVQSTVFCDCGFENVINLVPGTDIFSGQCEKCNQILSKKYEAMKK